LAIASTSWETPVELSVAVNKALERVSLESMTIHSDKDQKERSHVMDRFKDGSCKVLIATDVSARGIDIPNVEYVVNYDLPDVPENYVHRVGRTGRGVQKGTAISFCSPEEKETLEEIENFLDKPVSVISMSQGEYEATVDSSPAADHDWQSLMKEQLELEERKPVKKKGKRR
jgi:ATP-dependent RNA helicase RhlE